MKQRLLPPGSMRLAAASTCVRSLARLRRTRPSVGGSGEIRLVFPRARAEPSRVCVIQLGHIGDLAVSLTAVRDLSRAFPGAIIALVCGRWNESYARSTGLFGEILPVDYYSEISGERVHSVIPDGVLSSMGRFDLAVDLKVEAETRDVLARIDAGFRAGFYAPGSADALDLMFPCIIHKEWSWTGSSVPAGGLACALVGAVANEFQWPAGPRVVEAERQFTVGIATGCGTETHAWPIENFRELAARLSRERFVKVVLFGGPRDRHDAAAIAAHLPPGQAVVLAGERPLEMLTADILATDLYIGNDTGPTHVAAGSGVPTICIFSPSGLLGRFAPRGGDVTVLSASVACRGCGLSRVSDCPNDMMCNREISVDRVFREACAKLDQLARACVTGEDCHVV